MFPLVRPARYPFPFTSIRALAPTLTVPATSTSSLCICEAVEVQQVSRALPVSANAGATTRSAVTVPPPRVSGVVAVSTPLICSWLPAPSSRGVAPLKMASPSESNAPLSTDTWL